MLLLLMMGDLDGRSFTLVGSMLLRCWRTVAAWLMLLACCRPSISDARGNSGLGQMARPSKKKRKLNIAHLPNRQWKKFPTDSTVATLLASYGSDLLATQLLTAHRLVPPLILSNTGNRFPSIVSLPQKSFLDQILA